MYQKRSGKRTSIFKNEIWKDYLEFEFKILFLTFLKPVLSREPNEKGVRRVEVVVICQWSGKGSSDFANFHDLLEKYKFFVREKIWNKNVSTCFPTEYGRTKHKLHWESFKTTVFVEFLWFCCKIKPKWSPFATSLPNCDHFHSPNFFFV